MRKENLFIYATQKKKRKKIYDETWEGKGGSNVASLSGKWENKINKN